MAEDSVFRMISDLGLDQYHRTAKPSGKGIDFFFWQEHLGEVWKYSLPHQDIFSLFHFNHCICQPSHSKEGSKNHET